MKTADIVIVGAGIVGLALALELIKRDPGQKILVLEKESALGRHSSGRNSGVLHSGIYYPENSLKAKVCAEGAQEMAAFCEEHALPIKRIGKVVVPTSEKDDTLLDLLYRRGQSNGATVELIDEQTLHRIEPNARTASGRALHSPRTAVVDPLAILEKLSSELTKQGVEILTGQEVRAIDPSRSILETNSDKISFGHLYNAAGLYADKLARFFGVGEKYTILPFKGIYYQLDKASGIQVNGLIYPVPDLSVPFLGVHVTKAVTGNIYLGPTAVPAFGRENYSGLAGAGISEALGIGLRLFRQYASNNQGFRTFAHEEGLRFFKSNFAEAASALVPKLRPEHLLRSAKVGMRAQLLDKDKGELVMDFVVEKGENSTHILNAVSPGFTSAFSFSRFALDQV